jgi:hypothetical protein
MTQRGVCQYCRLPVYTTERAAFPVTGWEVERTEGGANRILDRKRTANMIAHAKCAEHHAKYGAQESMLP